MAEILQFKPREVQIPQIQKVIVCASCGTENDSTFQYCFQCGKRLRPEPRKSTKQKYTPKKKHTKLPLKTQDEIAAMQRELATPIKTTPAKRKQAQRNFVGFTLGISIGIRASDLVRLKVSDFFDQNGNAYSLTNEADEFGRAYVIEQKTFKGRVLKLDGRVIEMLRRYIAALDLDYNDYILFSQKGSYMEPNSWNDIIRGAAENLGWNGDFFGSHSIRKTFGYQFYTQANRISRERGFRALSMLSKELGHSSEAQTMIYIGIDVEEVCEVCKLTVDQYNLEFAKATIWEQGKENE